MPGSRRRRKKRGPDEVGPRLQPWHWVAAAVLVAAALRFLEIGTWSFWIDEAHTFRDATMPLEGERGFWTQDRAMYPMTYLGLRWLLDLQWVSTGEGAVRLPFALFGIATVPLMWLLGRRVVGERAAVFSAWLLALMPWHVYWSQNARGYVFVVLSAVMAGSAAWRWVAHRRVRYLVRSLLAIVVGTLFHPTAALQIVGLAAFLVLRRFEWRPRSAIIVLVLGALLMIALAKISPFQAFMTSNADLSALHFISTSGYYFRPLLLVAAVAGWLLIVRRHGRDRGLLLLCLALAPLIAMTVIGGTVAQTTARYAICALPALIWLAAYAATELASWPAGRGIAVRVVAGFVGLALVADFAVGTGRYFVHQHGDRAQWREACDYVRQRQPEAPLRVLTVNEPTVLYYLKRDHWRDLDDPNDQVQVQALLWWKLIGAWDEVQQHPPGGAEHLNWQLEQARAGNAEFAVMITIPQLREIDADGSIWRALRSDYELALHLPCWVGPKDESIYVFVPAGS